MQLACIIHYTNLHQDTFGRDVSQLIILPCLASSSHLVSCHRQSQYAPYKCHQRFPEIEPRNNIDGQTVKGLQRTVVNIAHHAVLTLKAQGVCHYHII